MNAAPAGALSRNPATGLVIEHFPFQGGGAIETLLADAVHGFGIWRAMPIRARADIYLRLAQVLRARQAEIAAAITAEMGKTLGESGAEVEKCAATAVWYAECGAAFLADEQVPVQGGDTAHVSYLPIGTVLGVMPWNLPLWQAIRAAVPIMLSGNGFLLKPAPNVMRCAYLLAECWQGSGLPHGVFGVLNTDNDGVAQVLADARIAAVTFTGGMQAGSAIAAQAGRLLKKSLLELGGTDPFIVLADADLDRAVAAGIKARFGNAGQVCLAAKRFILEAPIAPAFIDRFVAAARQLTVGDPMHPATAIGPLARGDLRAALHAQVVRTIAAGADLLLGGRMIDGPGFFYPATVLGNVQPGMAAFDEETFGPVAAMIVARDVEHAIALANCSDYGLSSNLWTADMDVARGMARRLETGGVFINGFSATNPRMPVGGVKQSGYGRELSHFGVREFANAQTVWCAGES